MFKTGDTNYPGDQPYALQDGWILEHYGVNELHFDSIKGYRNRFMAAKPNHPWNGLETKEFLYKIGAWGKLRDTGKEGLTLAGLLMFSEERVITEVLPHYFLEYRGDLAGFAEERWTDRLTSQDGTWSGNLYDFYFKSINKLTADLAIPFQINGFSRQDETVIHTALREALVNTLVHTDYFGERGIVIEREKDTFRFSNPGMMRVPIRQALEGGVSDLRNPNLFKMFVLIGMGERAGSGLHNISHTWDEREWENPEFIQQTEPARTVFILRMVYADRQETQEKNVEMGSSVNNDWKSMNNEDNSINNEWESVNNDFKSYNSGENSVNNEDNSYSNESNSYNNDANSYNKQDGSVNKQDVSFKTEDVSISDEEEEAEQDDASFSSGDVWDELWQEAELARKRKRLSPAVMENIIVVLCEKKPLMLKELAQLLERTPDGLRNNYLAKLLKEGKLRLRYPAQVNHPKQAYITVK
ncbi:ATP-binding protein [Aneurinibacillus tyrosinisolvens]|uniref:ATP-binding protein n=1 Tax=Aneurinibacillus tyrosinisolvens TaxID=1443435 RepID=UPI000A660253|nr:ATP-binding protein [Aneurinibacillus tyrosinisolvens]